MTASEAVTHTDSDKVVHLKIKFRIEKFEALMESTKPGEGRLWSEGVSSELAPLAVWKLGVYPNGLKEEHNGNIGVALWLAGLMKNLDATYHIYLVDGSGGSKIDVVGRRTNNFEKANCGSHVTHDRVKKALQEDGSLLVEADVELLIPCDGKTESEEKSTLQIQHFFGKIALFKIQQTIKFRIEEFEALMESTKPGEGRLWSESVMSKLAPRAVWMLQVDPIGWKEVYKGNVDVHLWLTGPMKDNEETLDATCHIYLVDGSNGSKIDLVKRRTRNFKGREDNWGRRVDHERVKKALRADGSLLVAADVEFLVPCDGEVEDCKYDQLEQQRNELTKDNKRLEDQLKTQKEESGKLSKTADELQKENDQLKLDTATLQTVRDSLHQENKKLVTALDGAVSERDAIKKQLDDAKEAADKQAKALMDEVAALKEKICKGCAPSGDETQKAPCAKSSFEPHSDHTSSDPAVEIEKHSICEALNVGNVIAMAMHADSNSLDTRSAHLLKEACLELIAHEWDVVYESAEWKELERDLPMFAADLAFGAATLTDVHTAEKFYEACLKLIVNKGKAVYESVAWKVLRETKPQFALDLAEGATAVSVEKSDGAK